MKKVIVGTLLGAAAVFTVLAVALQIILHMNPAPWGMPVLGAWVTLCAVGCNRGADIYNDWRPT